MIFGAHGAICAALLPVVMNINIKALRKRAADSSMLALYNALDRILARSKKPGLKTASWVTDLCQTLQIESLSHLGLKNADFPAVVVKSQKTTSMQGNPIRLTEEELLEILQMAY